MTKRYFAKCDLDDGRVFIKKGDELFLSRTRRNWLYRDGNYVCHTTSNKMEFIEVREGQQGHIHAELMMQYAQDAMETDKPWGLWEWYVPAIKGWVTMSSNPDWNTRTEYRRKPKMLSVTLANGEVVSWPAPHRTELGYGDTYYFVAVDGSTLVEEWDCLEWDRRILSDGWVHLTKEAAEQHASALRKINTQGF